MKTLRPILKLLNLKLMIELEILSIQLFLVKVILKIGQEIFIFIIESGSKTIPWTYKIQDLNREKVIESFYEKELLITL